jgi:starch synthase (maltosyl-transferring)
MVTEGRRRVVIEHVHPEIDGGYFPIKRVVGEKVVVQADIFADGHDTVSTRLLYKGPHDSGWKEVPMKCIGDDRWVGEFTVEDLGMYSYTPSGWVDQFKTWQKDMKKKLDAGQDVSVDIQTGIEYIVKASKRSIEEDKKKLEDFADLIRNEKDREKVLILILSKELSDLMDTYSERRFASEYERELSIVVDRSRALFSSWYEIFPRSCPSRPGAHGTFKDCESILPEIKRMGFDVLYLPPIHPIGGKNRKGRNNVLTVQPEDVGSPWAIGSEKGGHKAIHPALGTIEEFKRLISSARDHGMEMAMDLAFQCSPDHPYVREHPEWFRWHPDGSIQYAENPPKKYEDIIPLNFETEKWEELWHELKSVVTFWVEKGIRIFRVDNPHTKPFAFWKWLITEIKSEHPDVIFLSEAFTRPKVMYRLAKIGFTQSYTYFTWRNTKSELMHYMNELTQTEVIQYFRPNFWPNTPDILPEHLQYGGRPAFIIRLILASTLSSNYGIYGPAFELCVCEGIQGKEEYLNSEKYEIKNWKWDSEGNIKEFIARVNAIRIENPALQTTGNIKFYEVDNDYILFYGKATDDLSNIVLVVVNLDPFHVHSGWVRVPIHEFGIDPDQPYMVHDLLGDDKYIWQGERNYIEINPRVSPAFILRLRKKLKRETDFDYFM